MIFAGRLNKKVTLLAPQTPAVNTAGETDEQFREAWDIWAEVTTQSGREIVRNNQITAETVYVIRARYDEVTSQVTEMWQATYDGRTFKISKALNVKEANEDIEIIASQVRE